MQKRMLAAWSLQKNADGTAFAEILKEMPVADPPKKYFSQFTEFLMKVVSFYVSILVPSSSDLWDAAFSAAPAVI